MVPLAETAPRSRGGELPWTTIPCSHTTFQRLHTRRSALPPQLDAASQAPLQRVVVIRVSGIGAISLFVTEFANVGNPPIADSGCTNRGAHAQGPSLASTDLRRIALSLEGTTDRTAFRARRIHVTLAADGQTAKSCSPEEQEFKCMMAPEAFAPVPNAWGKRGATAAILSKLTTAELEDALRTAWRRAMSKKSR
jgi:hypothetical protein